MTLTYTVFPTVVVEVENHVLVLAPVLESSVLVVVEAPDEANVVVE